MMGALHSLDLGMMLTIAAGVALGLTVDRLCQVLAKLFLGRHQ